MTRILLPLLLLPTLALAQGTPRDGQVSFGWADVLRAQPVYEVVRVQRPTEICEDEVYYERQRGSGSTSGTLLGAVVGGALGNQVGRGSGRTAATVAGAVVGGAVGNEMTRGPDQERRSVATRCRIVETVTEEERLLGYDVEYRYRDEVFFTRMDQHPGDRIRVRVSVTPVP